MNKEDLSSKPVLWTTAYASSLNQTLRNFALHPEMLMNGYVYRRGKDDYILFKEDFFQEKMKMIFFPLRKNKKIILEKIEKILDELEALD
jgi:hypothetical protein